MQIEDLINKIRRELTLLEINRPEARAYLVASAVMESRVGQNVTTLASVYNNPYGVKFMDPNDKGKYHFKRLRGNQWDKSTYVDYRIYPSLNQAVHVEFINKFERPQAYRIPKERFGDGWPQNSIAHPDWPRWIEAIARIHCPDNPDHAAEVLTLWRRYMTQEATA